MFSVITNNPIAYSSYDHLYPNGTMCDNNTSIGFIFEIEEEFKKPIFFMDLGCAGGQLVIDFKRRGHYAIGLEGSDYSIVHKRAWWPNRHNTNLFTCDITKPFKVKFNDKDALFDVITSWEVTEHIETSDLPAYFTNVSNHLKPDGIFVGSIGLQQAFWMGVNLHRTCFPREKWMGEVLPQYFTMLDYNYSFNPREDAGPNSVYFKVKKKI